MTTSPKNLKRKLVILGVIGTFWICTSAQAQVTWTGGADPDENWSNAGNWSGGTPAGEDVLFDNTDKTASSTANSIVNSDMTLSSLSFVNTGNSSTTDWQVIQIGASQTLTLDGSGLLTPGNVFFLGSQDNSIKGKTYTYGKMLGGGSLVVNASNDDFLVTQVSNNDLGRAYLDLSGLSSFTANVANFYVGLGKRTHSQLNLSTTGAGTNVITASKLAIGDSDGSDPGGVSLLNLGTTNTLNVDDIYVGARADQSENAWQRASGAMAFQNTDDSSSVIIRAADGVSRANLSVGLMDATGWKVTNNYLTGTVDFTGGTVDALLGQLTMGDAASFRTGGATGTLSMDAGTIDATSVLLGLNEGRSQNSKFGSNGILNVAGGTFTAGSISLAENRGTGDLDDSNRAGAVSGTLNVSGTGTVNVVGDITMGSRTGGSADYIFDDNGTPLEKIGVLAEVDIAGGSLTVGGDMTENTANAELAVVTSVVTLHGGTLDMTGGTVKVDTFSLESGTLKNLGQYNNDDIIGADVVKTGAGTLNVEGDNTFTGATLINEGTLALITSGSNNIANSSSIVVADGATLDLTGVVGGFSLASGQTLGGDGSIVGDLTFASGSEFIFSLTDTLEATGTVSFDAFGIDNLVGLDSLVATGTYNLISGSVNSANIANIGSENAFDLGDGKSAYFEISSLDVVVIPEPSSFALVLLSLMAVITFRLRKN
ncbi:autotransporter-associated beta strand repeat-containing protein [Kiritimatiellota bacterium B12222]|nr:autotransporter-associated beta strand repeat-containing protein [Kiritimatiellota bacterium B12222]